jgi:DNA-directed RNA polymerase II subunit RPB2
MDKCLYDGIIIGLVRNPTELVNDFYLQRRTGHIHPTISISWNRLEQVIWIQTTAGRLVRPLLRMKDGVPMIEEAIRQTGAVTDTGEIGIPETSQRKRRGSRTTTKTEEDTRTGKTAMTSKYLEEIFAGIPFEKDVAYRKSFAGAITERALELIDPWEMDSLFVCPEYDSTQFHPEHTHMEIHASSLFGIVGGLIPYAPHNQGPRNIYSCAQTKQALAVYSRAYPRRFDHSSMVLLSPQKPLVTTWYGRKLQANYGMNVIVAFAAYSGYNQEDGVLLNKTSLQRGLFHVMKSIEFHLYEQHDEKTGAETRIQNPRLQEGVILKSGVDYSQLDSNGLLTEGTEIKPNMAIIGGVSKTIVNGREVYADASVITSRFDTGYLESRAVLEASRGLRIVKYRVSKVRIPEFGDKFSSRAGQKGTCGLVIPEEDMPRTREGIVPDLIVNPHAIPSRMTIGQFQESITAKVATLLGCEVDATAFTKSSTFTEDVKRMLERLGYHETGDEIMYSGITGDQMDTKIFIGPTYYMRLKHMSQDKLNYRAGGTDRGPVDLRTHQPIGGRAKEGGLRIGEMERDAILGHGSAMFLQESFNRRSDQGTALICNTTGYTAVDVPDKYGYPGLKSVIADGPFEYTGTDADNLVNITPGTHSMNFSEITMPYGLGVTLREIEAMGIDMRLITEAGGTKVRPGIELTDEQLMKLRDISPIQEPREPIGEIQREQPGEPIGEIEGEQPEEQPGEYREQVRERQEEEQGEQEGEGRQGIHLLTSLLNAHRDRQAITSAEQIGHGFTQAVKRGHFGGLLKTLVESSESQKAHQAASSLGVQEGDIIMMDMNQLGNGNGNGNTMEMMKSSNSNSNSKSRRRSFRGMNSDNFTEGTDRESSGKMPSQSGSGEGVKVIVNKSG